MIVQECVLFSNGINVLTVHYNVYELLKNLILIMDSSIGSVTKVITSKKVVLQKKTKSKMQSALERRMERNSTNWEDTIIESLIYPLLDGNKLFAIRQLQNKKKKCNNLMVLHATKIDSFINLLTKTKEKLNESQNEIIIDEWHLNSEQSKYRKTLCDLVVERMQPIFWTVVREKCYACEIDDPSQLHHDCLLTIDEINFLYIFPALMEEIDWKETNTACCSTLGKNVEKTRFYEMEELLTDVEWRSNTEELLREVISGE